MTGERGFAFDADVGDGGTNSANLDAQDRWRLARSSTGPGPQRCSTSAARCGLAETCPPQDLVAFVNRLNHEGVTVYRRRGARGVIGVLEAACEERLVFLESTRGRYQTSSETPLLPPN
jgi:hypothetical protein